MMEMIKKLSSEEIQEAAAFAGSQFSVDFYKLQPKLYLHPENGDTYAYMENGKICGMLSVYPCLYRGLSCLSVGTVCTAPEYRGRGIMGKLFTYLEEFVFPRYDLLTLAGRKRRYERFGFAKALCFPEYRYAGADTAPEGTLIELPGQEAEEVLYSLYCRFGPGVVREKGQLLPVLKSNEHEVFLLQWGGELAYVCCSPKKRMVTEFCGTLEVLQMAAILGQEWGTGDITFLGQTNRLNERLARECDSYSLRNHGNLRINHPGRVLPVLGYKGLAAWGNTPLPLEETYRIFSYGVDAPPQCEVPSCLWYLDGI